MLLFRNAEQMGLDLVIRQRVYGMPIKEKRVQEALGVHHLQDSLDMMSAHEDVKVASGCC